MRIAKGNFVEDKPEAKSLSTSNKALLVSTIRDRLLLVLGSNDSADFSIKEMENALLVNEGWASQKHASGSNFFQSYQEVVNDLTKDIIDEPVEVDPETEEVIKPAVSHKEYQVGMTFYSEE